MVYLLIAILSVLYSSGISAQTDTLELKYKTRALPFGLEKTIPENLPDVAIALSGGGARGIAQIGVLRALEEAGIRFNRIIGTSMGSVVGGLYSAGYSLDQLDSIFNNTRWDELLAPDRETNRRDLFVDQKITEDKAIFNLRLKGLTPIFPTSINDGQKLSNHLNLLVLNAPIHQPNNFDQLRYSFRSVCTDLRTGSQVVLGSGSLSQAMRASSSVSFLLSPVKVDSFLLVDGGLVANIPVNVAAEYSDYIIAVNTTSELHAIEDLAYPWFIADQIVSIPMKLLNEVQLQNADAVISPDLGPRASTDFTDLNSIVDLAYKQSVQNTEKISRDLDSLFIINLNKSEIYYKNLIAGTNVPAEAEKYILNYKAADSVSNYDIYRDLYELHQTGVFREIKVQITQQGDSVIVDYLTFYSPIIKKIIVNKKPYNAALSAEEPYDELVNTFYDPSKVSDYFISKLSEFRDRGYSLTEIEQIFFDESSGTLNLMFNEGIVDSIIISGNSFTNRGVIEREFRLNKGDYFKVDMVQEWLTNLRSTNLFDDINLTVNQEDGKNILNLRVQEKISSVLRLGFRIDTENKLQAGVDIRDENVFGSGTELGLLISLGGRNRNYVLEHKSNRIFNTYLTYKVNAFYQIDDTYLYLTDQQKSFNRFSRSIAGEYREIFYGTSLSLGTQVGRFGNFIFTGKYQFDELKNKTGLTASPYKLKIVSLRVSSTIDTQDKYPYPSSGLYFYGGYETAQTILGGDIVFANIMFDYKYHLTMDDLYTISPKITMGFGDNTLPLSQQYSLGGQNSFLGMREDEYRGRQIFISSLEFRYKLPVQIFFESYFRFRYDLGSIWNVQSQIRFKDLKHGVGATISIDTPVGPADFSIGRSFIFLKNDGINSVSLGEVFLYFSIGYYY